jgi:tRNA modification GTPase
VSAIAPALPAADTIVAAATPAGRGALGVVRLSGPRVPEIAAALLGALPVPRLATRANFLAQPGSPIDNGIALYFPAPHSYTGEHVLELQGHGGSVVIEALIRRALELGARRAQPGEFTQRAYLNGKLDLAQAEAVADLIDASSEGAARAAMRSLEGEFSAQVRSLGAQLAGVRVQIEAAIDFADQELEVLPDMAVREQLQRCARALATLLERSGQGRLLTEGITVVIAGPPNAGKSTLLNRLAGHEAAIVTALPGTTRDVLRELIQLDGMPLHVLDTAGLRAQAGDAIEAEGIRRAEAAMGRADRILFVIDAAADPQAEQFVAQRARLPAQVPVTLVLNKIDLCREAPRARTSEAIRLSARTGEGFETLRAHLKTSAGFRQGGEGALSARARHLEALVRCGQHLDHALQEVAQRGPRELVAEELRRAQLALGEILGTESSDELLGRIFSAFCIGK